MNLSTIVNNVNWIKKHDDVFRSITVDTTVLNSYSWLNVWIKYRYWCYCRSVPPELQGVSVKNMVRVIGESQVNGNASPTSSPILGRRSAGVATASVGTTARSLSAHSPTISKSIDSNFSLGNFPWLILALNRLFCRAVSQNSALLRNCQPWAVFLETWRVRRIVQFSELHRLSSKSLTLRSKGLKQC